MVGGARTAVGARPVIGARPVVGGQRVAVARPYGYPRSYRSYSYYPRSYYYGYYNRPLFWGPYGWAFGGGYSWGYGPYGFSGWQRGPFGYPYYGARYLASSIRVQVTPRQAEVFVDGYYAGIVDDFDGTFQRLNLEPGQHDVVIWAEGYRTLYEKLYLEPGRNYRIAKVMQPLGPGEPGEPRPMPPDEPERQAGPPWDVREPASPMPPQRQPMPPGRQPTPPGLEPTPPAREVRPTDDFGELVMRIQPAGATVLIDGEEWLGPENQPRLVVRLAPGEHRVEVRKQGYQTFTTTVYVTAGEPVTLNVSLYQD